MFRTHLKMVGIEYSSDVTIRQFSSQVIKISKEQYDYAKSVHIS